MIKIRPLTYCLAKMCIVYAILSVFEDDELKNTNEILEQLWMEDNPYGAIELLDSVGKDLNK